MQFFDIVKVTCSSGAGGDGCVAARREKYVPFGGPAGGNGGKGGSIILRGDAQLTTLGSLHARKHIKAPAGESGKIKEQYGKDAEDVVVLVPVGTIVRDLETNAIVVRIDHVDQEEVLLAGGRGGVGNMHFSNSVTQYANFGLLGEPGQVKKFEFELQLLADMALLGFPSVGKTSLLNAISSAAAKTAEYHFTTLVPNLGVVNNIAHPFVVIDIPGLIEGAAHGKGLGNEFLRHIMKARLWSLVADFSAYEAGMKLLIQLLDEIALYLETIVFSEQTITQRLNTTDNVLWRTVTDETTGTIVMQKQCIIVGNKIDLVQDEEIRQEMITTLVGYMESHRLVHASRTSLESWISLVSAGSHEGVDAWITQCVRVLEATPLDSGDDEEGGGTDLPELPHRRTRTQIEELSVKDITQEALPTLIEKDYLEQKDAKYVYIREVYHPEMVYLTFVIPRGNDEAELWYWRVLEKKLILKKMERAGVKKGDVFLIRSPYAGKEDRWVQWV